MPRKNSLKIYVKGGYYHLYNRGVEKRDIFLDNRDYKVFLYFLKQYLSPPEPPLPSIMIGTTGVTPARARPIKTVYGFVQLLAYCLMPNHFHLLIKQVSQDGITQLMNRIGTNYGMYFNKRYERVGPLFQGVYKAVLVESDEQLLHLSRYIHLNPFESENRDFQRLIEYPYSSYGDYLGIRKTEWVNSKEIASYFKRRKRIDKIDYFSYQSFVEDYKEEYALGGLALEG